MIGSHFRRMTRDVRYSFLLTVYIRTPGPYRVDHSKEKTLIIWIIRKPLVENCVLNKFKMSEVLKNGDPFLEVDIVVVWL